MSVGRQIARDILRQDRVRRTYGRLQWEAASRPESKQVPTPYGPIWMSPIEAQLYEALLKEGLTPVPQFYVRGYYADFAFPDVGLLVEADGAVHQDPARREHDRKRDWILGRAGWTVKRFHGTTIFHKASNCAFVVRKEVEGRRVEMARQAEDLERRRQARKDAMLRPFRMIAVLFQRRKPPA